MLYWWFVMKEKKTHNTIAQWIAEHAPENPSSFDMQQRLLKWKMIHEGLAQHSTEENIQSLYTLLLERISFTYGKQYEHMTLQEIQENKHLPENIVALLSQLYTPIYNQEEINIEKQKNLSQSIKTLVTSSTKN